MPIDYSVVIPTHNRIDVLPETLEALEAQTHSPSFEVILIDDGCTDGTTDFLKGWKSARPLTLIRQANAGPAIARNRGAAIAKGEFVAFLGDDTVPAADWLSQHAKRRAQFATPVAVVGYTRWHPRMRLTPLLFFLNEKGLQFGYSLIKDPDYLPYNFFYTSNLSLPRRLLEVEAFDESFPYPAFEDIELGYRLWKRQGLRTVYAPQAVVKHDHPTNYSRFARRQERAGYSGVVLYRRHPELAAEIGLVKDRPPDLPPAWRQCVRERVIETMEAAPLSLEKTWKAAFRYHYVAGMRRAWKELDMKPPIA